MHKQKFDLKTFINAFRGVLTAASTQINFRIHLVAVVLVCVFSVWLKVTLMEGLVLIIMITFVLAAEMVNTAIESLGDAVTLKKDKRIGIAKDVAAGAVLITAVFSVIVAAIIFLPKLYNLILNT